MCQACKGIGGTSLTDAKEMNVHAQILSTTTVGGYRGGTKVGESFAGTKPHLTRKVFLGFYRKGQELDSAM